MLPPDPRTAMLKRTLLVLSLASLPIAATAQTGGNLSKAEALEVYEMNRIWFQEAMVLGQGMEGPQASNWLLARPVKGSMGISLGGQEFYEEIGRSDLAEEYRARRNGNLLMALGAVAAYGLGYYMLMGEIDYMSDLPYYESYQGSRLLVPGGLILGGTVAAFVAYFRTPHPVSLNDAKRLTEEHNFQLRRDLGLMPDRDSGTEERRPLNVRATPTLLPNGGGLLVTGTF